MIQQTISKSLNIYRDDLYPFLGGGNKGRKINYIADDIIKHKCNAVVTTGGIQSNHCRALAIKAVQLGWACTIVIHGDKDAFYNQNGNSLLMRMSEANIVFVSREQISNAMDRAMEAYRSKGLKPYYVYGGGHTMEGGLAYIDAIEEMFDECGQLHWNPDYIFLASGTGSTQAGIMAGLDKYKLTTKVIGISIGRERRRAEEVVSNFYDKLRNHYDITSHKRSTTILDDYLYGGYGKYNDGIKKLSLSSLKKYGFILDTTYTAKAFYGMDDYIKKNNIKGNVLFWHTGGILNFLAEN